MHKYAQIDIDTGVCISVSYLSGEVEADHMIPLTNDQDVQPGDIYRAADGTWTRPEPQSVPEPEPSLQDRITQLETENTALKDRVEATEGALLAIMDLM